MMRIRRVFEMSFPGEVLLACAVLASAAVGAGCSGATTESVGTGRIGADGFDFQAHEVVVGRAERLTVLTAFLLDRAMADIVVVRRDEEGRAVLRVLGFEDGTWSERQAATLRSSVVFVDVAAIGGRDRLITYAPGHLCWYDPESGSERELVALTSNFRSPRRDEIPHVRIARDVNGDGRDDLVLPGVSGFHVLVQTRDGKFVNPLTVGVAPDLSRIYGADGYRYDPWSRSRVHEVDHDQDGRVDLVYWSNDCFKVHRQDASGRFVTTARSFTTDVRFDSDDVSYLARLASRETMGRVLHSFCDLNGDGVGDLIVQSLTAGPISRTRSSVDVHFGVSVDGGGTVHDSSPDVTLHSEGRIQIAVERTDLDGDGRDELMITTIARRFLEGSLWKRLKGAMGDDVRLGVEFHRLNAGNPEGRPAAILGIALDGVPSHREPGWVSPGIVFRGATHEARRTQETWPRAFNPTLRVADVNGDGLRDIVKSDHPRMTELRVGVPGPALFHRRSRSISLAMPGDEEYTWIADINRDGTQDIVMHHPFTLRDGHGARLNRAGTEPHRVVILIAR